MHRLTYILILAFGFINVFSQSPHGTGLKIDCAVCHDPSGWSMNYNTLQFDHSSSSFELEGAHRITDCKDCHTKLSFEGTPTECLACHNDMHGNSVGGDCSRCHNQKTWLVNNIPELHEENGFPLIGVHSSLSCNDCHLSETSLRFDRVGNECISCHRDDYMSTQTPNHLSSGFSTNCIECHDILEMGWDSKNIMHDFFPLTRGHDIENCNECHISNSFSDASPECVSCHQVDFGQTINPKHQSLNLSTNCISCHTTDPDWMPARFDNHNDFYLLNGAHAGLLNDCAACHNDDYNNTPNTCVGCHLSDYNSTTNPAHKQVQFSSDCKECHTENSWEPAQFDHDGQFFPIYSGEHQGEWDACTDCHTNPSTYSLFSCTNCHVNPETNEEHNGMSGYFYESNACFSCHPSGSADEGFDHNSTNFPILGRHIGVECISCHSGGYQGTSTDCNSCHNADYTSTTDPNHTLAHFPTDCRLCHSESGWEPSSFDHNTTNFPIQGRHIGVDCISCHSDGYQGTSTDCNSCHNADYTSTTDPNHTLAHFPTDCRLCHSESGWEPSSFDHNTTNFPIQGRHIGVECISCHSGGYQGTSTDCNSCHNADYTSTTDPNHTLAHFPTDCRLCHSESGWEPSSFDHNSTDFPLAGKHIGVDCASCHSDGYQGTPTYCSSCHHDDYLSTTDPNHTTAQFPTDCAQCHNESNWTPASFEHDALYFPIYSGKHRNEWNQCTDCHNNTSNYADFTCFTCHGQSQTNNDHSEVSGYQYVSARCLECHPDGSD